MDPKEIKKLDLQISYDEISDVLYVSFGDPRPAISNEVDYGNLVRTDFKTGEIVGVTILDFKERYMPPPKMSIEKSAQIILPEILKQFNA